MCIRDRVSTQSTGVCSWHMAGRWAVLGLTAGAGGYYMLHQELYNSRLDVVRNLESVSGVKIIQPLPESPLSENWETIKEATWQQFASGWNSRLNSLCETARDQSKDLNVPDVADTLRSAIQSIGKK
eukprot:TRINITY_DN5813_c0_g1_i2.p1 TRINITY_DN5813_c0_g1~~TRINITY_DN5813_c0_g1_i2.p1  ORF type:complete len:127 (+),score=30.58 TRINITY_DN5813_c0_g1_i2:135-515(+)